MSKTPVSVRLTEDELKLLERAATKFDGNKTRAFVEGLRLLVGEKELDLPAELERLARELRQTGRGRPHSVPSKSSQ